MTVAPQVSVVVPTALRRPALLERALQSVRDQVDVDVEVIVVADVPDGTSTESVGAGVRTIVTGGRRGASAARNQGVAAARGGWVAFLDDDDAWTPRKLMLQVDEAERGGPSTIVASCFTLILNGRRDRVMPPRAFASDADLSEWIFCVPTPFASRGLIPTSTIMASADLLRRCPFAVRPSGQDVDWLLRATRRHGARLVQLEAPLTDYYMEDDRERVSRSGSWRDVATYVEDNPDLFTPTGAAGALLTAAVRKSDGRRAYPTIVRRAFAVGTPRTADLAASVAFAFVPHAPRRLVGSAARSVMGRTR